MGISSALKEIRTVLDGITQGPEPEEDYLVRLTRPESFRCPIMLDDAVTVLRNLSITYKSDTTAITKAQLYTTIDEKFNSLRALLSRQNNDESCSATTLRASGRTVRGRNFSTDKHCCVAQRYFFLRRSTTLKLEYNLTEHFPTFKP